MDSLPAWFPCPSWTGYPAESSSSESLVIHHAARGNMRKICLDLVSPSEEQGGPNETADALIGCAVPSHFLSCHRTIRWVRGLLSCKPFVALRCWEAFSGVV